MNFEVKIEQFNGPLDLMLHLIKENKLDLFDLDISILVSQYINYINHFESIHLEIASEYLVELASLIEYKSKKLIPNNKDELEEEYEEDPKERLVRRLLEYQKIKEVTSEFDLLYKSRQLQIGKPISLQVDEWIKSVSDEKIEGNPYDLIKAMNNCLRRLKLSKPLETRIAKKEVSMEDRKLVIVERLSSLPKIFTFDNLLEDVKDVPTFITTFLAVLDLVRLHTLVFNIEDDTIYFTRGNK